MPKFLFFAIVVAVFFLGFFASRQTLDTFYKSILDKTAPVINLVTKPGCDDECQRLIKEEVSKAVASQSANTKTNPSPVSTSKPVLTVTQKPQVSYVPFGSDYSTNNTDWVDASANEVSFDINQDYSKGAKASWEASLRVDNANGVAYARIFDVTHGIAVDGSEIAVTDKSDFQRTSSGNINLWSGRNVYRVQIKSLNSSQIFYSGGKIRISF
jgi:hypothetical protein